MPEKTKKSILDAIFGTPTKKGLVDCITLCEFDTKLEEFYFGLTLEKGLDRFVHYFKTHKEGQIKYHVTKGAQYWHANSVMAQTDFMITK